MPTLTRTSYIAEVASVRHRVDPDSRVDVWILRLGAVGIEQIGPRTWREVAEGLAHAERGALFTLIRGALVPIACLSFVEEEAAILSSEERALIVDTLRETGHEEIADRCSLALDRVTKTDPPPPCSTPTMMRAAPKSAPRS